ncbi:MAG: diguanylate cyclase domain-containing protein [Enterocloster sp.]
MDLAAALRLAFRRNDITARIGGDEFIAFMPHIHVHGDVVPKKLETILCSLSRCAETDGKADAATGVENSAVTFSIGVSSYPDHGRDFPPSMKRLTAMPCTTPSEEVKTNITYIRKMHRRHKIPDLPEIKLMGAP